MILLQNIDKQSNSISNNEIIELVIILMTISNDYIV